MKKVILILSLCCIVAGLFLGCYKSNYYEKKLEREEMYFRTINAIIKDLDFHSAKVEEGKIVLYNKEREIISEIPFAYYNKNIKLIRARKEGSIVYFTTESAVDDEWGIMFVNDDSDKMMDGLNRVTRVGGNSYEFSTMR